MIKQMILTVILLCSLLASYSQAIYGGVVKDETTNTPVPYVTVKNVSTGVNTVTNSDGYFKILANIGDSLALTSVHYKSKFCIIERSNEELSIFLLPHHTVLQEVVVSTGYQTLPRERSTGSFVVVDSALFNRATGANVLNRLNGVAASLLFDKENGRPPLTIRGIGTLTNNAKTSRPLIVVDNFPYEGDIENINPNDVESVTLLRDAAAASIWGAKAGNGVIVITTKTSKINQPLRFQLNVNTTTQQKPNLFYIPQMPTSAFIDMERFLFDKGFYDSDLADVSDRQIISPVVEILSQKRLGLISEDEAMSQIEPLRQLDLRRDMAKYFYRRKWEQQYALSMSGGGRKSSFRLAAGYDKTHDNRVNNMNDRITIHSTLSIQPLPRLSILMKSQVTFSQAITNWHEPDIGNRVNYPYLQLVDSEGKSLPWVKDFRTLFKDTAGGGRLLDWRYYPLDELQNADNRTSQKDVLFVVNPSWQLTKFLKAEAIYQFNSATVEAKNIYTEEQYYTRNLINLYTTITESGLERAVPRGTIRDFNHQRLYSHAARGQLNFNHRISKHSLNAITGAEVKKTIREGESFRVYGSSENLTSIPVDYAASHPILFGLPYDPRIPSNLNLTGLDDRMVSLYANASYEYDHRYIFSGSARRDASNILGVATNNKWKPLWSSGFSWNISNESFYNISWLPTLKYRLTYGYSGNVNNAIPAVTTLEFTQINRHRLSNLPYAAIDNVSNSNLRWEQIGMFNTGFDFATTDQRLSGSLEYYIKKSTDVIAPVPVDITQTGFNTLEKNSATMKGYGWDLSINTININAAFKWQTNLIYSLNKVKVTEMLYEREPRSLISNGTVMRPLVGQPPYHIISLKWAGLNPENGNPRGYLNGELSENYREMTRPATLNDLEISGSATPTQFGALRNTFSYKSLSLSCNFIYRLGYYIRRRGLSYTELFAGGRTNADFLKRWQTPGDELRTQIPSLVYPTDSYRDRFFLNSAATVYKADHLRFNDIQCNYELPTSLRHPQRQARIYLYISNLGIIWKADKNGADPEFIESPPPPVSYTIGCSVNF
ncbi:SusC/RagA family TonB-linked outer membrane protein [Niabella insulamsoli]|uniref:SusC/RagA family TonB-linked outer membrane protein n=1 Tax=Niabella insulamsoli TaxID=3144874 RepID=UPI0031FDC0D6